MSGLWDAICYGVVDPERELPSAWASEEIGRAANLEANRYLAALKAEVADGQRLIRLLEARKAAR